MTDESRLARLEQRIDELESRHALRDLASEYCHGFDKRDFERFLARSSVAAAGSAPP